MWISWLFLTSLLGLSLEIVLSQSEDLTAGSTTWHFAFFRSDSFVGQDNEVCGSKDQPCLHLKSVMNKLKEGDTVMLITDKSETTQGGHHIIEKMCVDCFHIAPKFNINLFVVFQSTQVQKTLMLVLLTTQRFLFCCKKQDSLLPSLSNQISEFHTAIRPESSSSDL